MFYALGKLDALLKLGMASGAGPIAYKSKREDTVDSFDYAADKPEELWSEFDRSDLSTGEESGIGMPSAGGINKNANEYSGTRTQGAFDANKEKPHKDHIISSAMQESFKSLDEYDKGYAEESAITQPHGSKYADNAFAGSSFMGANDMVPKPPKPPGTESQGAIKSNTKPQDDEDAGMNLVKQVQQQSRDNDTNNSFASPQKRLTGSPL